MPHLLVHLGPSLCLDGRTQAPLPVLCSSPSTTPDARSRRRFLLHLPLPAALTKQHALPASGLAAATAARAAAAAAARAGSAEICEATAAPLPPPSPPPSLSPPPRQGRLGYAKQPLKTGSKHISSPIDRSMGWWLWLLICVLWRYPALCRCNCRRRALHAPSAGRSAAPVEALRKKAQPFSPMAF
jgi:hypothetical protein